MRKLLPLITALFFSIGLSAQSIPNGDFENWSYTAYQDPTGYQTANEQNLRNNEPIAVFRVTDSYHAKYAVQMKTLKSGSDTIASFIANGQPGNWTGGCPISGIPTGMRLYYKFHITSADTALIIVALKKKDSVIGQYFFAVADTSSSYILFSQSFFPALTVAPDTVIFAAASSTRIINSNNEGWAPNSYFQVDSVTFTGIATQPSQLNGDFENWVSDTSFTLNQWSFSQNSDSGNATRTTDAYSGKYAVMLKTGPCGGCGNNVNPQAISTGKTNQHTGPTGGYPYTVAADSLDTLVFYYKYIPSVNNPNDTAQVSIQFHSNNSSNTWNNQVLLSAAASYTKMRFPIDFHHSMWNNSWYPDSVMIGVQSSYCSFCSGNLPIGDIGSVLKVDKMSFTSQLSITITPPNATICSGGPGVSLTANGAANYTWSPSTGLSATTGATVTAKPGSTTTYTVTGKTGTLTGTQKITVTVDLPPTILVTPSSASICAGDSVTLTASGAGSGGTYKWTPSKGLNDTITASVIAKPAATKTYQAIGTTSAGCTNGSSVTVTVKATPTVTVSPASPAICPGNSVTITASGATTYSWSPSTSVSCSTCSAPVFSPSSTTNYMVTGKGSNGCTATANVTVSVDNTMNVSATSTATTCGEANGTASETVTGGTSPYSYLWTTSPTQTNASISNLASGNYTVTVTDGFGCSSIGKTTVGASSGPGISFKVTPGTCGNSNGKIVATVTGGTSPYAYSWNNGQTKATADSLGAGVYILTVTDKNGCSNFLAATVSDTNGPSLTVNSVTDILCNGASTGAISVSASGGLAPYQYMWSNSATTSNINSLPAGPYQVTVTDANGCQVLQSVTITQPAALSLSGSTTQAGCSLNNGSASVSVSGGATPYAYSWNTGATTTNITGVGAGSYSVTVTDHNGCSNTDVISVSNASGPVVSIDSMSNVSCTTGTLGYLSVSVTGGSAPYAYAWNTSATTSSISGLSAGSYAVTVTDADGCAGNTNTTIGQSLPPAISICEVTVDPANNYNNVEWDKTTTRHIASYNVYKETTSPGVYNLIGSVSAAGSGPYVDSLSDARKRSWRYEISQVDSCGNESPLSLPHKTMHLTISAGAGNSVNLVWDNYQGLAFGYYIVYRDSVAGIAVDSIDYVTNSGIYTYTDYPPVSAPWYYHMGIPNAGGCSMAFKRVEAINYNSSKSNSGNITAGPLAVQNITNINHLDIFPNPTTGLFNMSFSVSKQQNVAIKIYNALGQLITTENYGKLNGKVQEQLDLTGYSKGVYTIQIVTDNGVMYRKVVIQ